METKTVIFKLPPYFFVAMNVEQYYGKILIIVGILIVVAGLLLFSGGASMFSWIGNLPGDIRVEQENYKIYFPITTMILFSIVLSLILWIFS